MSSVVRRAWAIALAVLVICLAGAPTPASGHAVLLASIPVDGSTVDTSPSELSLQFDEDVHVRSTVFHLFDGNGTPIAAARSRVARPAVRQRRDGRRRAAALVVADGRYLVRWQSITSDDFHPVSGSFTFGVGVAAGVDRARRPIVVLGAPLETLVRTAAIVGYAVLAGGVVLLLLLRAMLVAAPRARVRVERSATVGLLAGVGGLAALAALLVVESGAAPPSSFLGYWALGVVGLVVAGGCVWTAVARAPGPRATVGAGAVGLVCARRSRRTGSVTSGHGVCELGLACCRPCTSSRRRSGPAAWRCSRWWCCSTVATTRWTGAQRCAGSGSWRSPRSCCRRSPGSSSRVRSSRRRTGSTGTGYGRGLLLKLGLVAAAVALGALAFRAARSDKAVRNGPRLVVELTVMVGILAIAASLSAGQPPDDRHWQPTPTEPATAGLLSADVDDLVAHSHARPWRPGANFATVAVLDTRRPTPAQVSAVLVDLGGPSAVAAVQQRDSGTTQSFPGADPDTTWVASGAITSSGRHDIRVTVRRDGLPDAVATFPWQLAPAPGSEAGGSDLSAMWTLLAVAVVVVALLVLALTVHLRRRRQAAMSSRAGQRQPDARQPEASLV